jgi:hypothetical protein
MDPDLNYLFKSIKPSATAPVAAVKVVSYKSVFSTLSSISSDKSWKPEPIPFKRASILEKYSSAVIVPA